MAVRPDMAGITDVERGLALDVTFRVPLSPVPKEAIRAADLRDAARNLGKVFVAMPGDQRLRDWALPNDRIAMDERTLPWQLDAPTKAVFGGNMGLDARIRAYDEAHVIAIPEVARAALIFAFNTLAGHTTTLKALGSEVAEPAFADWMHEASQLIAAKSADCRKSADEWYRSQMQAGPSTSGVRPRTGLPPYRAGDWPELPGRIARHCAVNTTESFIQGEKLVVDADEQAAPQPRYDYVSPSAARKTYVELLQVLRCHKQFSEIVDAYARSAAEGTRVAQKLLKAATEAVKEFADRLGAHPGNVWQYSALIIGSVRRLNLDDVPGFQDYALAIGQVLAAKLPENLLNFVGAGLFIIGMSLQGPPGIAYLLVDLAAGSAGAAFSYMRAREREMAVKATMFLPDEQKFATEYSYGETILAGAFALLATYSVVRSLKAAPPSPAPGAGIPPQGASAKGPIPPATQPSSALKKVEPLPPRGTPEAPVGTPASTATGTPAATATGTPAATSTGTPKSTATGSSAIDPDVAERIRRKIRKGGQQAPPPAAKTQVKPSPMDQVKSAPAAKPQDKSAPAAKKQIKPAETMDRATDAKATRGEDAVVGGTGAAGTTPKTPPGSSSVADTSFTISQEQRAFSTKTLTAKTEEAVGAKLEQATGLTSKSKRTKAAQVLKEQILPNSKAPPVTEPALMKEPVITDPRYPAPKDNLASAKPDYLLLGPKQHEVFEVTMDSRFSIVPQERGIQYRGSTTSLGDPHKQIQVRKTLDYLIRRYPDHVIVYNIQTIGEVPKEVLKILELEQEIARKLIAAERGSGSVEIVVRAAETHVIR